jgi:hypothetical protein
MIDVEGQWFRDAIADVIDMESYTAAFETLENMRKFWASAHRPDFLARIDEVAARLRESQKLSRRKRGKGPLTIRQIEKREGKPVASMTIAPDGSRTYSFGDTTQPASTTTDANPWDKLYA